jgi:hypothetical protein
MVDMYGGSGSSEDPSVRFLIEIALHNKKKVIVSSRKKDKANKFFDVFI